MKSKSSENFEEELKGKSPLGITKRRYEDNIKVGLKERERNNMHWTYLNRCVVQVELSPRALVIKAIRGVE
jgi:hypothetical protein